MFLIEEAISEHNRPLISKLTEMGAIIEEEEKRHPCNWTKTSKNQQMLRQCRILVSQQTCKHK